MAGVGGTSKIMRYAPEIRTVRPTTQYMQDEGEERLAGVEGTSKIKRFAPEIRMVRPTTQYMIG